MRLGTIPAHVDIGCGDYLKQGIVPGKTTGDGAVSVVSSTQVTADKAVCWISNPGLNGTIGGVGGDYGQDQLQVGWPPAPVVRNILSGTDSSLSSIPAATSGRLDQIIVLLTHPGGTTSAFRIAGTIDSGAVTLNNRTGAVDDSTLYRTYGEGWLRLADILVTSAGVLAGNIRDARMSALATDPVGAITPYAASTAPLGWLICDGSAISRFLYADLFTVIGTTYGTGDGSSTFNLPDMQGRVAVGVGTATGAAGATAHTLAQKTGEETHQLLTANMPSHNHAPASGTNFCESTGAAFANATSPSIGGANTIHSTTANAGGNGSHNNMQPYLGLNHIIKL